MDSCVLSDFSSNSGLAGDHFKLKIPYFENDSKTNHP